MKELMIIFFISLMFIHSVSAIGEIYSENEIFIIGEGICQINLKFIINDDYQGFPDSRIYLRKGDTGEDFSVSYSTTVMGYWHVYPESFLSGWELIYNESTNTLALEETADCDVDACIDSDNGKDYNTKGEVNGGFSLDIIKNYPDRCITTKLLEETYCEDILRVSSELYECPGQCENGKCIEEDKNQSTCTESWSCAEWSNCIGVVQIRHCTDSNSCGTMANKPSTSKDCEVDDKEQEEKQEENTCPEITSLNCPEGSDLEDEKDSKGCSIGYKCRRVLSNGIESEIKIMPETASEKAIERLGELDFIIELKEVGKGDEVKAVYEAKAKKQGNFLGLFKIKGEVIVNIDSETGEIVYIKKPWWSFLVSGI